MEEDGKHKEDTIQEEQPPQPEKVESPPNTSPQLLGAKPKKFSERINQKSAIPNKKQENYPEYSDNKKIANNRHDLQRKAGGPDESTRDYKKENHREVISAQNDQTVASTVSKGQHVKNKPFNQKESEKHFQRKSNNHNVYWNSNLKDGETSRQYIREYDKAKKQKETQDEKNASKRSHHTEKKLPVPSYHSDVKDSEPLPRRLSEFSTKKTGKKTNVMKTLKISTTANGRVVEIEEQPLDDKFHEMKHVDFVQSRPTERPKIKGNHKHSNRTVNDQIEHSNFTGVEENPEETMQYQLRDQNYRRQRFDQARPSRSNVSDSRNKRTTQVFDPSDRNHSRGDLAETFQNITIVSPEPDKTLIKLISEVSKQQKKQQTLLREIETRLTNQKMIENATKNHIEHPPHHSTSWKHYTMQQQHAPPHLAVPQTEYVGSSPYTFASDSSTQFQQTPNRYRSYLRPTSYDPRMDVNAIGSSYASVSGTPSPSQSFPSMREQNSIFNNAPVLHPEYSSRLQSNAPGSMYHWGSNGSPISSRYYDDFSSRQTGQDHY